MKWLAFRLFGVGRTIYSGLGPQRLRPLLRRVGKRLYHKDQHGQLEDNIDFVLKVVDDLCVVSSDPAAFRAVERSFHNWDKLYLEGQRIGGRNPAFVTYTEEEREIPFRPDLDLDYAAIMSTITHLAARMVERGEGERLLPAIEALDDLHHIAHHAFTGATSCMARYTDHNRIALGLVQKYDPPTNCAPSLHQADYDLFHTMTHVWGHQDLIDYVKERALEMPSTVLGVKQHTLSDVACAMMAAQISAERAGMPYQDLAPSYLNGVSEKHPEIPYDKIIENRDHLRQLRRRAVDPQDLRDLVLRFYEEKNFPITGPGDYDYLVDEKGKKVKYAPGKAA